MTGAVKEVLKDIVGHATELLDAGGAGRLFELYVTTGIACALKVRRYDVWIRRSNGSRVLPTDRQREFVQRGGVPAGIPPASHGPGGASSIAFSRVGGPEWELLNGVTFEGRSGALHEIDIAIVPASVATSLRNAHGGSPLGRPRVSIECKDAGTNGTVDEMRAFIARLYDTTMLTFHHRYLPVFGPTRVIHPDAPPDPVHRPVRSYWRENRRTLNVLARRTGFVHGAAALSGYRAVAPHGGITVGSPTAAALMDDVADWICSQRY